MEPKKYEMLNLTWEQCQDKCEILSRYISISRHINNDIDPIDIIVCVGRGGMIPSRLIAESLNIKDIVMYNISSYNSIGLEGKSEIKETIPFNYYDILSYKNVLIVDDVATTMSSINYIRQKIIMNRADNVMYCRAIYSATLYCNKNLSSNNRPDFIASEYDANNTWIVFPWEKN